MGINEKVIKNIHDEILAAMVKKGISQTELSLKLGLNKGYIARVLDGANCPTITTLAKIADALGETLNISFGSKKGIK